MIIKVMKSFGAHALCHAPNARLLLCQPQSCVG